MKSPINYEPISLIKTKVNEKTEVIRPIFQANNVNHESLNEEMQWLQSLIEMRCKELFLEDDLALDIGKDPGQHCFSRSRRTIEESDKTRFKIVFIGFEKAILQCFDIMTNGFYLLSYMVF